jgi:peptide chain release factor 1
MSFDDKLAGLISKHKELGEKLADPDGLGGKEFGRLSKEYSDLTPIVERIHTYENAKKLLIDLKAMMDDKTSDKEMRELAEMEYHELKEQLPTIERTLKLSLLPKDKADEKNAILEVRAGTGGEEAALFAAVLFNMYQRYAERRGWKFEILSLDDTGIGGYKEAQASISGNNVFARLKFESGVHRVQRVPATESSGRIHTSAATVAVLPEAEEVDIQINENDLKIDTFRSSGAGGQSVNTTDSAIRITHMPTGVVVSCQDERSQHKNKAKAMKIIRARVYEAERERQHATRSESRKSQVGSGDRSERIRTYNFPQSRVSDHRIYLTSHNIDGIVNGGDLDPIIEALITNDEAERLSEDSDA